MRRTILLIAVSGALLAGCGSGGHSTAATSSTSLSPADLQACDTLNQHEADPRALYAAFGPGGTQDGHMSSKIGPFAQLVSGSAQLEATGYTGDSKLGEYVGQMRGACEALGWHTAR